MARIFIISLFSKNMERYCAFYKELFGFPELPGTDIFKVLDCGNMTLGFHSSHAYEALNLRDRAEGNSIKQCITFEVDSREEIDEKVAETLRLGGSVIKSPSITYYNHYQAVLGDIEDNVFRITCPI